MRDGMYWSGDLAYRDAEGWIYLAGRTADWMRVDGENIAAAPIERILLRHSAINLRRGIRRPGDGSGDQVMAAVVLQRRRRPRHRGVRSVPPMLSPTCPPRRGHDTCVSPSSCPAPPPTKCSSAS